MSDYTQSELQDMSRVQLRRAAIATLGIDNREASNTKSSELIERILESSGGGGGNGEEKKAAPKKSPAKKARTTKAAAAKEKAAPAASTNGVGKMVDAVGKAVDETKEELAAKLDTVIENQDHLMRQLFIMFGLVCDVYKAVDEPDVLEGRLEELDEEWNSQGNE